MPFARTAQATQENATIPSGGELGLQAATNGTDVSAAAVNATSALPMPEPVFSWSAYFEALGWLFIGLGLLWLVLRYVKKRGGLNLPGASLGLAIEGRLALGPKRWLLVVRFQDRRLLLGVTDHHISFLTDLDGKENTLECMEEFAGEKQGSFSDILKAKGASPQKKEP